jgi:hypothetical protein
MYLLKIYGADLKGGHRRSTINRWPQNGISVVNVALYAYSGEVKAITNEHT